MLGFTQWTRGAEEKKISICAKYSPSTGSILIPTKIGIESVYMTLATDIIDNFIQLDKCPSGKTLGSINIENCVNKDYENQDSVILSIRNQSILCTREKLASSLFFMANTQEEVSEIKNHQFYAVHNILSSQNMNEEHGEQRILFPSILDNAQNLFSLCRPNPNKITTIGNLIASNQIFNATFFLDMTALENMSQDDKIIKIEIGKVIPPTNLGAKIPLLGNMDTVGHFIKIKKIMVESQNGERQTIATDLIGMVDLSSPRTYFSENIGAGLYDCLKTDSGVEIYGREWELSQLWDEGSLTKTKFFINEPISTVGIDEEISFDILNVPIDESPKIVFWFQAQEGVVEIKVDRNSYMKVSPALCTSQKFLVKSENYFVKSFGTICKSLDLLFEATVDIDDDVCSLGNNIFCSKQVFFDYENGFMTVHE